MGTGTLTNSDTSHASLCTAQTSPAADGQENVPPAATSSQKGNGHALTGKPSAASLALSATVEATDLLKDIKDDATAFKTVVLTSMSQFMASTTSMGADLKTLVASLSTTNDRISVLETKMQEYKGLLHDFSHSSTVATATADAELTAEVMSVRAELLHTQRKLVHVEVILAAGFPDMRDRIEALEDYDGQRNVEFESTASTSSADGSPTRSHPPDHFPLQRFPSSDEVIDVDAPDASDGAVYDDEDGSDPDWVEDTSRQRLRSPARGRSNSVVET